MSSHFWSISKPHPANSVSVREDHFGYPILFIISHISEVFCDNNMDIGLISQIYRMKALRAEEVVL